MATLALRPMTPRELALFAELQLTVPVVGIREGERVNEWQIEYADGRTSVVRVSGPVTMQALRDAGFHAGA